jgi:AmmeMemoRadiSam system protein A
MPLIELIVEMTIASATEDPRFAGSRIKTSELNKLDIEISVLSPLKKTDDPLSLRLGVDGIYIKRGFASGCFLPQVATETGWSKEEFLSYCCAHKAGLEPEAWKDPETEVSLFTADVFGANFIKI